MALTGQLFMLHEVTISNINSELKISLWSNNITGNKWYIPSSDVGQYFWSTVWQWQHIFSITCVISRAIHNINKHFASRILQVKQISRQPRFFRYERAWDKSLIIIIIIIWNLLSSFIRMTHLTHNLILITTSIRVKAICWLFSISWKWTSWLAE